MCRCEGPANQGLLRAIDHPGQNTVWETVAFDVDSGVRQGWALYSTSFNYAVEWVLNDTLTDYTWVQVGRSCRISDLADDIAIFESRHEAIQ